MAMVGKERQKMTWFIRRESPKNKKNVITFFKSNIWQSKNGDALYSWKYENNPAGSALMWLATDGTNNNIISSGIMMPWRIQICENEVTSFQAVDAFTHKNYRGQGIFTALSKQQLLDLAKMNVSFIFAFPSKKALPIVLKLGWHQIGYIRTWAKPLKFKYILNKIVGNNPILRYLGACIDIILRLSSRERHYQKSSKYRMREIKEFDKRFDTLWDKASKKFKVAVTRDSKYLNWRYVNNPDKNYIIFSIEKDHNLAGFVVFNIEQESGHIIDILTEQDDETINYLIAYTIQYLRGQNISVINFSASEDNFYAGYFKKFGFYLHPGKNPFITYIPNSDRVNPAISLDFKNWFITIGDRDV